MEFLGQPTIVKERFHKKYRHPVLDTKLTRGRLLAVGRAARSTPTKIAS